ncbi:TPA: type 4b pilus protein PilO2 [Serratia marcescens]
MPQTATITLGAHTLIAGLQWQYLPLRGRRNMKLRAKGAGANYWASISVGDSQTPGSLLGTAFLNDKARQNKKLASLALSVQPNLAANSYAVFALPDGRYWFIAVYSGHLSPFSDSIGDADEIRRTVERFLQFTPQPEKGWQAIAPIGFLETELEERQLASMIGPTVSRKSRLNRTHDRRPLWISVGIGLAVTIATFGHKAWQRHTEQIRIAHAQAALMAEQAKTPVAETLRPWAAQPQFPLMLAACSDVWKRAPISIAGWIFNTSGCNADGKIILHYRLPNGGTVGDFAQRLPLIYGPNVQPIFNIPGAADDAAFSLNVPLPAPGTSESLLPGDTQIQRLTSYAQQTSARFRLAPIELAQGDAAALPWRTYSFTFITDIPPDRLFAPSRFDSSGIRATEITTALENSRLKYTIEGVLYAQR